MLTPACAQAFNRSLHRFLSALEWTLQNLAPRHMPARRLSDLPLSGSWPDANMISRTTGRERMITAAAGARGGANATARDCPERRRVYYG